MVKLILGYILLLTLLTGLVYRNSIYHVLFVPDRPNTTKLREKPQERTEKANRKKTVRKKTRRPGKKNITH